MRNGTEEKYESDEFRNGDDLYLYFKSPINGYLAVYLLDENTQQVFCLLPYKSSGEPAYKIIHDKPYVFFSCQKADGNPNEVDEYTMTCEHSMEQNTIYIVFSPNMFAKAFAEDGSIGLPRQLLLKEFQKWLGKHKAKDTAIQIQCFTLKISKLIPTDAIILGIATMTKNCKLRKYVHCFPRPPEENGRLQRLLFQPERREAPQNKAELQ